MSEFDPVMHSESRRQKVDFIVPERIREAVAARGLSYEEAAELCKIDKHKFGLMANGHVEIPRRYIFHLMSGLDFPRDFFYFVRWERR
ncbi:hypothetical protein [Faecalispora jeddahensis]|uniref:hypothetical protein n=1 Tax=Faecalispora jeddahensis TaxID=1414721 RepID=UPI001897C3A8|nr:hypothetical protein [Faecalispora jeddahensis]MDU6306647.1 hypothetical protein [Clostridium sp.]MDU6348316.1 hypothetical protein [Clostridium sp.]